VLPPAPRADHAAFRAAQLAGGLDRVRPDSIPQLKVGGFTITAQQLSAQLDAHHPSPGQEPEYNKPVRQASNYAIDLCRHLQSLLDDNLASIHIPGCLHRPSVVRKPKEPNDQPWPGQALLRQAGVRRDQITREGGCTLARTYLLGTIRRWR